MARLQKVCELLKFRSKLVMHTCACVCSWRHDPQVPEAAPMSLRRLHVVTFLAPPAHPAALAAYPPSCGPSAWDAFPPKAPHSIHVPTLGHLPREDPGGGRTKGDPASPTCLLRNTDETPPPLSPESVTPREGLGGLGSRNFPKGQHFPS